MVFVFGFCKVWICVCFVMSNVWLCVCAGILKCGFEYLWV